MVQLARSLGEEGRGKEKAGEGEEEPAHDAELSPESAPVLLRGKDDGRRRPEHDFRERNRRLTMLEAPRRRRFGGPGSRTAI
jgi:hypothetical protein